MLYRLNRPTDDDLRAWATRLRDVPPGDERRRLAGIAALPAAWRTRDRLTAPEWPALADLDLWRSVGSSHALQFFPPSLTTLPADGQPPPYQVAYATGYLTTMQGHLMPEDNIDTIVQSSANALDLGDKTLEVYMTGDASELDPEYQAGVLVALHKMFGLNPLSKAWIIVDGKIYPTAAAASAVRRRHNLEADVLETSVLELGGVQLVKCVAECREPSTGRAERATSFVPWQVEVVTEWGTSSTGKRFPKSKEWHAPNPEQVANKMMKASTKAIRRATLLFAALGSSAAEDVPGESRDWIQQIDEPPPPSIEAPHADEAGG